jgi:hypothetical protein
MKILKLMEGMVRCAQCGAPMYAVWGLYCSKHCEALGECGEYE